MGVDCEEEGQAGGGQREPDIPKSSLFGWTQRPELGPLTFSPLILACVDTFNPNGVRKETQTHKVRLIMARKNEQRHFVQLW